MKPGTLRISTVFLLAVLSLARAATAQSLLVGRVTSRDGTPLPGARVTVEGDSKVTKVDGRFMLIGYFFGATNIATVQMDGFKTARFWFLNDSSGNPVEFTLEPIDPAPGSRDAATPSEPTAPAADAPDVSPDVFPDDATDVQPPPLEWHGIEEGTRRTEQELRDIPVARDPWAILQQAPGVLADRVNVGDSESGHASMYVAPGSSTNASTYLVDGVVITDFTSPGSSPTYYDFAFVDGVDVTTGGGGTSVASGGPVLNILTKGGTNRIAGSGLYRFDPSRQSGASLAVGAYPLDSRVTKLHDYSATLGGPLLKDKWWFFAGSSGQKGTWNFGAADGRFDSPGSFTSNSVNVDGVPAISDRINVFFLDSTRSQLGPSSDLGRATSSLWNSDTSLKTFKIEDHHIFNSNIFLTGTYSLVRAGVHLAPVAGDTPVIYGTNDVWRNGFILYNSDRPQDAFRVDGSNFFNHGSLSQELKFGASYRHADVAESTRWPQGFAYLEEPDGTFSRFFVGNSDTTSSNQFTDFYLQHQLRLGSLTTTVGIRVEHDKGTDGPNTRSGNPLVSLVQPVAQPARQTVDEHNVAPRLGVSWSPPVERRLVFSAGYGLYFDQLPLPFTGFSTDVRGKTAPDGSIVVNDANLLLGTFDPVKNLIDSNFSATKMSEVSGGVETAVGRNFILGARYTQRNLQDLPVLRDLVLDGRAPRVATTNDTFLFGNLVGTDPNGAAVSIPVYALKLGVTSYPGGGQLLTNGFAETHYKGASLTFNRRLANHWMLRGTFSFNDWTWDLPASETVLRPFGLTVGAGLDGEAVAPHSAAPDGVGVYINSKYSVQHERPVPDRQPQAVGRGCVVQFLWASGISDAVLCVASRAQSAGQRRERLSISRPRRSGCRPAKDICLDKVESHRRLRSLQSRQRWDGAPA